MTLNGSVALVTGGNRGLGDKFVQALLEAGASKVYAAARDPRTITAEGVVPIALDLTDHASVLAAAEQAQDVTLLINNAGSSTGAGILDGDFAAFRLEYDTHVLGTLDVTRSFAPVLARNGGGAVLNVLSVLSWLSLPQSAAYCAAKAAEWSITNSLRVQLADQGTHVTALHVGYMDTDMIASLDVPKADPAEIARIALEGLEKGLLEVVADDVSKNVQAGLSAGVEALHPRLARG
ncbi:SDR family oxidoreductase [Streptomyces griseoloalbus]|uniref:NAD(P)-dependent dehydrogenase (Short-subunit alcohol dehydrogenase family) n=1 Tax=Streptomyces griseoloalbus TaxID=67303 RepID=A0A7W8BRH0_9ACTN|nr:SDR family oxidoreductase [Streptomyces albaduncus]MBB5128242.1 NAD(P)-dependent dehydrogenase (short-subunit alcohol dehydrogenase family) [Streptomyces albaduncus]GGV82779.1 short-chain dehydrogenase [Streptomyces griseoloalbus]GGW54227.1 short-chain dehydrogenase [Streptomyces albaduncus]